ncbi:hypothetical protein BDZ97DRAFT_2032270 [Flammula alnicola]|nr:hypothetical protein BDZ97DRAFT_2032270 [Flammula alnicola]
MLPGQAHQAKVVCKRVNSIPFQLGAHALPPVVGIGGLSPCRIHAVWVIVRVDLRLLELPLRDGGEDVCYWETLALSGGGGGTDDVEAVVSTDIVATCGRSFDFDRDSEVGDVNIDGRRGYEAVYVPCGSPNSYGGTWAKPLAKHISNIVDYRETVKESLEIQAQLDLENVRLMPNNIIPNLAAFRKYYKNSLNTPIHAPLCNPNHKSDRPRMHLSTSGPVHIDVDKEEATSSQGYVLRLPIAYYPGLYSRDRDCCRSTAATTTCQHFKVIGIEILSHKPNVVASLLSPNFQTVEPGDMSGEIDEAWLRAAELDHGKEDNVMIRLQHGFPTLPPSHSNSTPTSLEATPVHIQGGAVFKAVLAAMLSSPAARGSRTPGLNGQADTWVSWVKVTGKREDKAYRLLSFLLAVGTTIGTLADNKKSDHPSLSGNARISVICTINPDAAVSESMSTLLFAKRIKSVQLHAQKKEVVDTDALIERYRKEIEELKARLTEREAEVPARSRRLSTRANRRIQSDARSTKLILTSAAVDESKEGDSESRPVRPVKIHFEMSPYQLQQELLAARLQLARPPLPADASSDEKDMLIAEQTKTICELEIAVGGYEENLGKPLRKSEKLEEEKKKSEKSERWAEEVAKALEKEKKAKQTLEEERRSSLRLQIRFSGSQNGFAALQA